MKIKTDGLEEMNKAIRDYARVSSKTHDQVLKHRANRFAWSLFSVYQGQARRTRKKIHARDPRRMKIWDGKQRSKRAEKGRRLFAAGYVATGWLPAMRRLQVRDGATVRNVMAKVRAPRGGVIFRKREIVLINSTPGAVEADAKHNLSSKAGRRQARDMQRYLQRKANQNLQRSFR